MGTNTIRQNYSREGGLDHLIANGGTITEAVSTQVWSGEAAVHVSIVNWIKGESPGVKKLFFQKGDDLDSPWEVVERETINSSLSAFVDVSGAARLQININSGGCYQGQTHGHEGFLLEKNQYERIARKSPKCKEVIFPYLTADEMLSLPDSIPIRYVIDFHPRDILAARGFTEAFRRVEETVLPVRETAAAAEKIRNMEVLAKNSKAKVNQHHRNFLAKWWLLSYPRSEMIKTLGKLPRFIICGRVTRRPIFEFSSNEIRPNDALQVFAFADDYSFGILQSGIHWAWFTARCSTLKGDFRYTSDTVFDTFPWPQSPTLTQTRKVADAAVALRGLRREVMGENKWSLRELYRSLELPGQNPLRDAHAELDAAVRAAYGMKNKEDPLAFLLALNAASAQREARGEAVTAPGLPPCVADASPFLSADCIQPPEW